MSTPSSHRHHKKSKRHQSKIPLISVQMASKTYAEDPLDYKTLVLRNIYLDIFDGEFVTIFGPSGSGKSTLLNLIAGLEKPTAGRVLVKRRDLAKFDNDELAQFHRRKMGFVFQNFNLIKSLNVWENVALPQTASGINYAKRKQAAIKLLKLFHLDHYADRHPNELSGGEQQRVAIARALVNDPYFLLVDEPTGNLDSKSAEEVMQILQEIHDKEHHTIILVSHNPNQLKFASRVIYMEDGQIVIEENRDENHPDTILPKTAKLADTTQTSTISKTDSDISTTEKLETPNIHTKITGQKAPPASQQPKSQAIPKPALIEKQTVSDDDKVKLPPATSQTVEKSSIANTSGNPAADTNSTPPVSPSKDSKPTTPAPPKAPVELVNTDVVKTVILDKKEDT